MTFQDLNSRAVSGSWHTQALPSKAHKILVKIKNMFLSKNNLKLFGLQCLRESQVGTKGHSVSLGVFYSVYHFICTISLLSN